MDGASMAATLVAILGGLFSIWRFSLKPGMSDLKRWIKETRKTVQNHRKSTSKRFNDVHKKLDDHSDRLARVEENIGGNSRRLSRVEENVDNNTDRLIQVEKNVQWLRNNSEGED